VHTVIRDLLEQAGTTNTKNFPSERPMQRFSMDPQLQSYGEGSVGKSIGERIELCKKGNTSI
jgi:hypothetical protein